jgi:hypothetical protein
LNLVEPGAVFEKNNAGGTQTVLEQAHASNIAVLANRPLNAISGDRLLRLAEPPEFAQAPQFDQQLGKVAALEAEFGKTLAKRIRTESGSAGSGQLFAWAEQLKDVPARLQSYEQWRETEAHTIAPQIGQLFRALDDVLTGEAEAAWREWRTRYVVELEGLFASLRKRSADRSRSHTQRFRRALEPILPESARAAPLSRTAIWVVTRTPGVTAALVGMRQLTYVTDALAVLTLGPLEDVPALYERARSVAIE